LHLLPNASRFKRLPRGQSVRRVIGIRDRDAMNFRVCEVFNLLELERALGRGPHRDPAAPVDRLRALDEKSLLLELIDKAFVGRGEDVERRTILDLPGE
jgi:hypothetical protein